MTKLACSFTGHLDLCDSKVGGFSHSRACSPHLVLPGGSDGCPNQATQGQGSGGRRPVPIHPADKELESDTNHHHQHQV